VVHLVSQSTGSGSQWRLGTEVPLPARRMSRRAIWPRPRSRRRQGVAKLVISERNGATLLVVTARFSWPPARVSQWPLTHAVPGPWLRRWSRQGPLPSREIGEPVEDWGFHRHVRRRPGPDHGDLYDLVDAMRSARRVQPLMERKHGLSLRDGPAPVLFGELGLRLLGGCFAQRPAVSVSQRTPRPREKPCL